MSPSASPARPRPPLIRTVGVLVVVVLLGGLAAAYQVGVVARRGPSFDRGGAFLSAADTPVPGRDGTPYPYGDAAAASTTTTVTSSSTAAAPASTAPVTSSTVPATTTTELDRTTSPHPPAVGTYTYAVSGTEAATGFGSRGYPDRASVVVHRDAGIRADELVHDLRLSDQHEEREIVRYTPAGIAFSFEGGSITFGPGTQTSQATYDPLMVQIPFPLQVGAKATASSAARNGGTVERTEVWTAKVVRTEVLTVLGAPHQTWVVDLQRTTTPGGSEQVDRFRRYWYDPELGIWVKWTERFHASRNLVLDFTYDTTYTATLVGFRPR